LLWSDVRPRIERAFADEPDIEVVIYPPAGAPDASDLRVAENDRPLTRTRALLLSVLDAYAAYADAATTRLEVQKLAYFLQAVGEQLKLDFKKAIYGPYAHSLAHLLRDLEGGLVEGAVRDPERPLDEITLKANAGDRARERLQGDTRASASAQQVIELVGDFADPFALELLSTVHWVAIESPPARTDVDFAMEGVHQWNRQERRKFSRYQIRVAWEHLGAKGWFERDARHA
jgi:hypothetical protein